MNKRLKTCSLVPHSIQQRPQAQAHAQPEGEQIVLEGPRIFMPPRVFGEFVDVHVSSYDTAVVVFLGSTEERFRHERIELAPNHFLSASLDPFNWICIQCLNANNETKAFLTHSKRIIDNAIELPKVDDDKREAFSEDSTVTLDFECCTKLEKESWKDCVNAMVHWYQVSPANAEFWVHPQLIRWLEDVTSLKLSYPKQRPVWKRFQPGTYEILNDKYPQHAGLDLIFTLGSVGMKSEAANWIYLDEGGDELLRVPCDKPNSMTLVYRTASEDGGEASIKRFKEYFQHTGDDAYSTQMVITYPVIIHEE